MGEKLTKAEADRQQDDLWGRLDIKSLADEIIEAIDDSLDEGWSPTWARRGIEKVLLAALTLRAPADEALLTSAEQKTQAGRCACRGFDDMCVCQNVPDRQTKKERAGRAALSREEGR